MSDALIFSFCLLDTGAILFLLVYYNCVFPYLECYENKVITISDFECDYLNVGECCEKLNGWTFVKLLAHALLVPLFLLSGHWWLSLMNLPTVVWLAYEYYTVPPGNIGVYDPTEISKRGQLSKHLRNCLIFLGWYLASFFIYLYFLIIAILQGHPLEKPAPLNAEEVPEL